MQKRRFHTIKLRCEASLSDNIYHVLQTVLMQDLNALCPRGRAVQD